MKSKSKVVYVDFSKKDNNRGKKIYIKIINMIKKLFHLDKKLSTPRNVINYKKNIS